LQFNDDEFALVVFAEQVDSVGLIIFIFGDGFSVEDGGHPNILPEQFAEEALKDSVVRFLFQQALHGPIEADEGTAGEFGCRHACNLIRAVGTSRMTDVCFRKHTTAGQSYLMNNVSWGLFGNQMQCNAMN